MAADEERAACDLCGAPVPEESFLFLEVHRLVVTSNGSDQDLFGVVFCSQQHAADWLARPLPPPVPFDPPGPDRWGRVAMAALAVVAVVVLGLAAVGALFLLSLR